MIPTTHRSLPARALTVLSLVLLIALAFTLISGPESSPALRKRMTRFEARQASSSAQPSAPGGSSTVSRSPTVPSTSSRTTTSSRPPSPTSTPPPPPVTSSATPSVSSTVSSLSSIVSVPSTVIAPPAAVTPFIPPVGPASTLDIPTLTDDPDLPAETSDSADSSGAAGKGFFGNKAAVAATFSVAGLIGVGILFAAGTFVMRRRSDRNSPDDEFFEKYPEADTNLHHNGSPDDNVSTHDVTTQAATDAYPDRHIHYGGNLQPTLPQVYPAQQSYAPDAYQQYPQGQQYPQQAQYAQQGPYAAEAYDVAYPPGATYTEPQYDMGETYSVNPANPSAAVPAQRYAAPSQQQAGMSAPPVAFREQAGRDSYQQSIDSFYGANAQ